MRFRLSAVVALLVLLGVAAPAWGHGKPEKPKRVLVIVLDQFRPDLVDKFDMRNVRALMRDGVNFENAYLGHMASETVITHNVITSGQLPKDMGWADEAFRDSDNVLGVADESMWITGSLTRDQFNLLIAQKGYAKLADYLHAKYPGTKFIAAGQKDYAVHTSNGPTGDISVTFSGRNFDCDGDGANNWRGPTGLNVPAYISAPSCGRFYVDSSSSVTYGTGTTPPAWMYPLDGQRFAVGRDPAHLRRRRLDHRRRPGHDGARAVERHAAHARLDRQGEPHVGRHHRRRDLPAGLGRGAGASALHRQDRRRAGRPPHAPAEGARPARRDARRAHHRPRRPALQALPRRQRGRPRQQQLVLRRDPERHFPGAVAVARLR